MLRAWASMPMHFNCTDRSIDRQTDRHLSLDLLLGGARPPGGPILSMWRAANNVGALIVTIGFWGFLVVIKV